MKRTSILVEVSDKVYEHVVEPHKKAKTFSKLIATLLTGYIENDYIQSYAEGTLETMHRASVDALDDVLGNMQQSLANMGIYTDELKDNTEEGVNFFSEKMNNTSLNPSPSAQSREEEVSEEINELKTSVANLQSSNAEILKLLQSLVSGSAQVNPQVEVKKESFEEPKKVENFTGLSNIEESTPIIPLKLVPESNVTEEKEVESAPKTNAMDILAKMKTGNTYSF